MPDEENKDTTIDTDVDTDVDSVPDEDDLELEVGDHIREEAEAEGGWPEENAEDLGDGMDVAEEDMPSPGDVPEPVAPSPRSPRRPLMIPAATVLGRTGEAVWGKPKPKRRKHELDDLFEVPHAKDNDIYCDDLVEFTAEDADPDIDDLVDNDISDLVGVSREDVMGRPYKPRHPRPPRYRRTNRPYNPPTSVGGV